LDDHWARRYAPWRFRGDLTGELSSLNRDETKETLVSLGSDLASVLRDGWVYWNLAEHLKIAELAEPTRLDGVAGWVVDRMGAFDMQSAQKAEGEGGPPSPTNSRPFRGVLNYLLAKLGDVKEFLGRAAQAFGALLRRVAEGTTTGVTVGIEAPWPTFSLGFQADVSLEPFVQEALQLFQRQLSKFTV
jgi:hypothetical protein